MFKYSFLYEQIILFIGLERNFSGTYCVCNKMLNNDEMGDGEMVPKMLRKRLWLKYLSNIEWLC